MCGNRRTLENDPRRKIQPSLCKKVACGHFFAQLVEKPPGVRGPQPPEALIGFGDMRVKSAKSLA